MSPRWTSYWDAPIPLAVGEALTAYDINSGTNTESTDVIIFATDGNLGNPFLNAAGQLADSNGNRLRLRDGPVHLVGHADCRRMDHGHAHAHPGAPVGTYACLGMKAASATGIAARLLFQGQQVRNRPGAPCAASSYNTVDPGLAKFRMGRARPVRCVHLPDTPPDGGPGVRSGHLR